MLKFPIKNIKSLEEFNSYTSFIDSEVEAFTKIKSLIIARIKLDKKYSADVIKDTTGKRKTTLEGFIIEKCWNMIQDQIDETSRIISASCDLLEREQISKLDALIREEVDAKNKLIRDKNKFDESLRALKNFHDRAKEEYQNSARSVNEAKARYFNYEKETKKTADRQDRLKNDVLSAGAKLHVSHNNYLLALNEYNSYRNLLYETLFPNLLASHQEIKERMLEEFQTILQAFHNHVNLARPELGEKYSCIELVIKEIDPSKDYTGNIIKPNQNVTTKTMLYSETIEFDENSIAQAGDFIQPQLECNQISAVGQTMANLNTLRMNFQRKHDELESKIQTLNSEIIKFNNATFLTSKLKYIDLTNEKAECENHKIEIEKINEQLLHYSDIQDPVDIDARFNPIIPIKPLPKPPHKPSLPTYVIPPHSIIKQIKQRQDTGMFNHNLKINDQPWFHGTLPRKDVEEKLLNVDGDFLVRESTNRLTHKPSALATSYVVSLKCVGNQKYNHYIIYQNKETLNYSIDESGLEFTKISELLENYVSERERIPNFDETTRMIRPVLRQSWEISNKELHIIKEIESGNFGVVYEGKYNNKIVAIKSLKPKEMDVKFEQEEIKKFLSEGKLLQKYSHRNIVQFIGIAVDSDPIKIVMEFIDGGSLHKYLRENYDLPIQQILKFSEECALGMEYLASNRVVHRDLAARNCLLTKDLILKITDFGLSRQLEDEDEVYIINALKSIPIRWSAPEVFNKHIFSTKSDVWSYGVTVWEIAYNAELPYKQYDTKSVKTLIAQKGEKLSCPPNIATKIYTDLMEPCWEFNEDSRPDFTDILKTIAKLKKIL